MEEFAAAIRVALAERDALAAENAALKAQSDCDLRKDLICAIWPEMLRIYDNASNGNNWDLVRINARAQALQDADAMIAAIRRAKEER